MKRFVALVYIFTFAAAMACHLHAFAQGDVKMLQQQIEKTSGKTKVDLLNQLSVAYRASDRQQSLMSAREAGLQAKLAKYDQGLALALKNEGVIWFFLGNNDSASYCYENALTIYRKLGDQKGQSALYNNLGLVAQERGHYDEAVRQYEQSIAIDRKLGDVTGAALTQQNIADILLYQGKPAAALELLNRALEVQTKAGDKVEMMNVMNTRASAYDYMNRHDKAISDEKAMLAIAVQQNDKYRMAQAFANLGLFVWHTGNADTAMSLLNRSLELSDENEDAFSSISALQTMADIYTDRQQYGKSTDILLNILKLNEESGNQRQVATTLTAMGHNLLCLGETDQAIAYFKQSLAISSELGASYESAENYSKLIMAVSAKRDFKAADSLSELYAETLAKLNVAQPDEPGKKTETTATPAPGNPTSFPLWITAIALMLVILYISIAGFGKH